MLTVKEVEAAAVHGHACPKCRMVENIRCKNKSRWLEHPHRERVLLVPREYFTPIGLVLTD